MLKKILVLSPYPFDKAPSQRLKYEQYYEHFENEGFEITTSSFIESDFWSVIYKPKNVHLKVFYTLKGYVRRVRDLLRATKYDIVYVHLWCTPFGPPIYEYLLQKINPQIVYDIDDLVYLGETSKSNSIIASIKGRNKPIALMKYAKHVIVCTPKLEDFVKKINPNTTDISSTINTDVYIPKSNYEIDGKIVIGWSGSHSTSKYLYLLKDVLVELKRDLDFKLLVIGDSNFHIDGLDVEAIEWNLETEVLNLLRIDIGLYPLPDEEWVYGKSGLKALQYMALGIPTIATAIGANYRVIEDGVSGFLIPHDSLSQWKEKIISLYNDTNLRMTLGKNARDRVESFYSIKENKHRYLNIFNKLLFPNTIK